MTLEDFLGDIDKSFADKKQQEIYAIYGLAVAVLIALSYLLFWDSAEQGYKQTLQDVKAIEKKIQQDENYLKRYTEATVATLKAQTKKLEQDFLALKDQSEYIKYKVEQISSLYYDEAAWGEFIDSISTSAKKYGLTLKYLSNEFPDDKSTFGHVLDIEVKSHGSFHRTMKFMNALEQSFLVVDIHKVDLIASTKVDSNLKISVWGMTY